MIGPRSQATALIIAGLAAVGSYLWLRNLALPIAGAFLVGTGTSWLLALRRRTPAQREQEHMIRDLWSAARHLPAGRVLQDPVTGSGVFAERERGFLTLAIADPTGPGDQARRREATVSRYLLGFLASPSPPPLYRHTAPLHEKCLAPMPWRQARALLRFNDQTGASETSPAELAELRVQLERAIAAAGITSHARSQARQPQR